MATSQNILNYICSELKSLFIQWMLLFPISTFIKMSDNYPILNVTFSALKILTQNSANI